MAKSNQFPLLLIGVVLLLLVFNTGLRGGLMSLFGLGSVPEGYIVYDDFSIPDAAITGYIQTVNSGIPSSNCSINGDVISCRSEKWMVEGKASTNYYNYDSSSGLTGATFSLKTAKALDGYDIKVVGTVTSTCAFSSGGTCGAASLTAATPAVSTSGRLSAATSSKAGGSTTKSVSLSILSSVLDSDYQEAQEDSEQILTSGSSNLPKQLTISASADRSQYSWQGYGTVNLKAVYVKLPFSCEFGPNEFLAYETFAGGRELGLYSFRYPVVKFCLAHPVVINEAGSGTTTSAEPYQAWVKGETLTVPSDQNWGVFYIMRNDGTLPLTCDPTTSAYNVATKQCTNVTGLVQICSDGSDFDPALGVCATHPEVRAVCEFGRYDNALNACVYNPPLQGVCSIPQAVYIPSTGKCEFTPAVSFECGNYTYNPARQVCEAFPLRIVLCQDPLAAYDSALDKCVRHMDTSVDCAGVYDSVANTCTQTLPAQPSCSQGTLFQNAQGVYSCIYEPSLTHSCPQGSYDSSLDACVMVPNLQYLCTRGTLNENRTACVITPQTKITCSVGIYNDASGVCESSAFASTIFGLKFDWKVVLVIVAVLIAAMFLITRKKG